MIIDIYPVLTVGQAFINIVSLLLSQNLIIIGHRFGRTQLAGGRVCETNSVSLQSLCYL